MAAEHSFKTIDKDIKAGNIPSSVILYGREQYLVKWSVNRLINKYINEASKAFDLAVLEGESASADDIIACCETMPLGSERRVVYIPDLALISAQLSKKTGENDTQRLADYLTDLPEFCLLVMTCGEPAKNAVFKNCGKAYEFPRLDEATLRAYIKKRFTAAGKTISPSVVNALIDSTGYTGRNSEYTIYDLENDIEKLVRYTESDTVTFGDVRTVVSGDTEKNVFGMIDAISRGRREEVFRLYYNLLASGESPQRIPPLLMNQFELMLEVKELADEGHSVSEIAGILGMKSQNDFRIKKALTDGKKFSAQSLRNILTKIYRMDANMKSGLMDTGLALEIFMAEV